MTPFSPQKSILTLVFAFCQPLAVCQEPMAINLESEPDAQIFFESQVPAELLCLQALDRCQQKFNQVLELIPQENMTLKEQLIQAKVTTLHTIVRSSAINYASQGDFARAIALLEGLFAQLQEYSTISDWDNLIYKTSPFLQ